jgi:hypothetical protein
MRWGQVFHKKQETDERRPQITNTASHSIRNILRNIASKLASFICPSFPISVVLRVSQNLHPPAIFARRSKDMSLRLLVIRERVSDRFICHRYNAAPRTPVLDDAASKTERNYKDPHFKQKKNELHTKPSSRNTTINSMLRRR